MNFGGAEDRIQIRPRFTHASITSPISCSISRKTLLGARDSVVPDQTSSLPSTDQRFDIIQLSGVDTYTSGSQSAPEVEVDAATSCFMVVWASDGSGGDDSGEDD